MPDQVGRRRFVSQVAAAGLLGGLPALSDFSGKNSLPRVFTASEQESDEKLFAAARRELLFPTDITFCNTGTLGASPGEVVDAVVNAYRTIEHDLPDWPYRPKPTDVPPMSGYLPSRSSARRSVRF